MSGINLGVTERKDNGSRGKGMVPSITFDKSTNLVRMEFDEPVEWVEINPEKALGFALTMIKAASRGFVVKKNGNG